MRYCSISFHMLDVYKRQALDMANKANNAKTVFLNSMSHDIRTPMNAIIGFTDLLNDNLSDQDKARDYIAKIISSSDYLLSLINNVLEMARIESGKTELDESSISLKSLDSVYWLSLIHISLKMKPLKKGISQPQSFPGPLRSESPGICKKA